jgi:uncharacterized tellurite resistance protein B-like protein
LENTTRKLMKLLQLKPDEIYHIFCLALCVTYADGEVTEGEGEGLTRLGFGMGLSPEDISALVENARQAVKETSTADVIAFSLANLKSSLTTEQLGGVKQILRFVAGSDKKISSSEKVILDLVNEIWSD